MKRLTIKDVAQAAGVSYTTVSHVINHTRRVDPDTSKRVTDAILALGYHPNIIARSLRKGETNTIGLIVPDASNLFFAEIARKIEDFGYNQGYSVILCNSDNNPKKQESYINTLLAKQVDGVIFISAGGEPKDLHLFNQNKIPVVVADRDVPVELADVVLIDNEKAGFEAVSYLIELGHTCIACITGSNDLSPSMQRFEGFKKAHRKKGLKWNPALVSNGQFTFSSGESVMASLLTQSPRPTAVFALNDMMAIGAMTAARKAGLVIPGEISFIGFDDIELASAITPALTTIAQPIEEMARFATEMLIDRIQGKRTGGNIRKILPARLVIRESTASHRN